MLKTCEAHLQETISIIRKNEHMKIVFTYLLILLLGQTVMGQETQKIKGPVILGYGDTWVIDSSELQLDPNLKYHLIFDLYKKPEDASKVNASINTLARFINMHVNAGVNMDKIKLIAVVHGTAGNDMMQDEFHFKKYGVNNPNAELIAKLNSAGVEFYLCGQTMHSRGLDRNLLLPEVKVALSAMTAIYTYTSKGYTLIKF